MILPPPPAAPQLAATKAMLVKLVFPPRSKEQDASSVPAPDLVIRKIDPQVIVDADPTETVAIAVTGVVLCIPTGALAVPVIARTPVMVFVTPF